MQDHDDSVHGSIHAKTPRQRLLIGMDALLEHRKKGRVHYTQGARRMMIVRQRLIPPFGTKVIHEDCSSAATGLYFMAGLHDPNELHFNGTGFTGTLCPNGRKASAPFSVGDLVFYGEGAPFTHVAVVYREGKVWSHGHDGGPLVLPIDYRSDRREVRRYLMK